MPSEQPGVPGPEVVWAAPRPPNELREVPGTPGYVFADTLQGLPRKRRVPGAPGLIYAGVIPRTLAWFVDAFLIAVVSLVALSILITVIVGPPRSDDAADPALSTIAWIGIAVIAAVYFIGFWTGGRRATPGMRIMRLQIGFVATGEPLTARQAGLRVVALGIPFWPLVAIPVINIVSVAILALWPVVLLISTAVNARRRGLHDRAAWSAVVMPGPRAPARQVQSAT